MDWLAPLPVSDSVAMTPWQRALWLFGHYDLRVYLEPTHYIELGAGSMTAVHNVKLVRNAAPGCIGRIGRHCEFSDCEIQATGEHRNDLPLNITFHAIPIYNQAAETFGLGSRLKAALPIDIGNAVVVSSQAIIHPGVRVGDGAVIADSAIVHREVEPFTIVGGVPARLMHNRPRAAPWWDLAPEYLLANMARLQEIALTADGPKRPDGPRFIMRVAGPNAEICGFVAGGVESPMSEAPEAVQAYVKQALAPELRYWLADVWRAR